MSDGENELLSHMDAIMDWFTNPGRERYAMAFGLFLLFVCPALSFYVVYLLAKVAIHNPYYLLLYAGIVGLGYLFSRNEIRRKLK